MGKDRRAKEIAKNPIDLNLRRGGPIWQIPDVDPMAHPRGERIEPAPEGGDRRIEIGRLVGRDKVSPLINLSHPNGKQGLQSLRSTLLPAIFARTA